MLLAFFRAIRFVWTATRGSRLRPWRSEYLRWRLETYSGQPAKTIRLRDFLHLILTEHRQFVRFLLWTGDMHAIARNTSDGARH